MAYNAYCKASVITKTWTHISNQLSNIALYRRRYNLNQSYMGNYLRLFISHGVAMESAVADLLRSPRHCNLDTRNILMMRTPFGVTTTIYDFLGELSWRFVGGAEFVESALITEPLQSRERSGGSMTTRADCRFHSQICQHRSPSSKG